MVSGSSAHLARSLASSLFSFSCSLSSSSFPSSSSQSAHLILWSLSFILSSLGLIWPGCYEPPASMLGAIRPSSCPSPLFSSFLILVSCCFPLRPNSPPLPSCSPFPPLPFPLPFLLISSARHLSSPLGRGLNFLGLSASQPICLLPLARLCFPLSSPLIVLPDLPCLPCSCPVFCSCSPCRRCSCSPPLSFLLASTAHLIPHFQMFERSLSTSFCP